MSTEEKTDNNYKETLKATSLFGGVQVFDILIRIIRSKFIAILLGPTGMGIAGLLNSTTELISAFTNFGLRSSAVRNIAEANATNDIKRVSLVISVLRKLVWYTGLLGTFVCLFGASYWSQLTFGNREYTYAFLILSSSVLFIQLTYGQNVLLQGLQKYQYLAKATLIGHSIGLVITVPLYYFWGIDAIVPVLLLANIVTFIIAYYFARKIHIEKASVKWDDIKGIGGNMLKIGILISMQGLLSTLSAYLLRIFINSHGGIDEVGLFNAGFTIINTYIGLVLTAMGTDYYPRLSKVASDKPVFEKTINQQAEIALLLLAPIVIAFVVFIRLVIIVLYSSKFSPIEGMLYWAISATLFKSLAWTLSYSMLAKGDSKAFFWSEFSAIIYGFGLNVLGYLLFGLTGLGISFLLIYILYFFQLMILTRYRYHLFFNSEVWRIFLKLNIYLIATFVIRLFLPEWVAYIIGTVLLLVVLFFSYKELDKRIAIGKTIKSVILRSKKNEL